MLAARLPVASVRGASGGAALWACENLATRRKGGRRRDGVRMAHEKRRTAASGCTKRATKSRSAPKLSAGCLGSYRSASPVPRTPPLDRTVRIASSAPPCGASLRASRSPAVRHGFRGSRVGRRTARRRRRVFDKTPGHHRHPAAATREITPRPASAVTSTINHGANAEHGQEEGPLPHVDTGRRPPRLLQSAGECP